MAIRKARRHSRSLTILPLHASSAPNVVSCWYCDAKIYAFNDVLFSVGFRHSRFLKMWFNVGVALSVLTLVGVSAMLLWDMIDAFNGLAETSGVNYLLGKWLFGTSFWFPGLSVSIIDVGYMIVSTFLSVGLHEFGHAIAAASEGLRIEYIGVFLAILFPGAFVAFNYDWLQSLTHSAALRIYCAGIWHNVTFCAACILTLISLPTILHPFYAHGEGPMVLGVSKTSPLHGYLSPYDIIVAVDGSKITNPHEWTNMMIELESQMLPEPSNTMSIENSIVRNHRKGYCVPDTWIEAASKSNSCSGEVAGFLRGPCFNSSLVFESPGNKKNQSEDMLCLVAREIVKLKKCWSDWKMDDPSRKICECSVGENCMTPVQVRGMSWVEVSYLSPYSSGCLKYRRNSSVYNENGDFGSSFCGGTFVYIGDVLSVAHSIQLTAYQPRWAPMIYLANIPHMLEKILSCCFRISASLALVNSLPVYFLDGEAILETFFCYFTFINRRHRRNVLQFCLVGGTILSVISFSRIVYSAVVPK